MCLAQTSTMVSNTSAPSQRHCGCLVLQLNDNTRPVPTLNRPELPPLSVTRQPQMITAPALPPETPACSCRVARRHAFDQVGEHAAPARCLTASCVHYARKPAMATWRELVLRVVPCRRAPITAPQPSHQSERRERMHVAGVSSERSQEIHAVFVSRQSPILASSGMWFAELEAPKRSRTLHP